MRLLLLFLCLVVSLTAADRIVRVRLHLPAAVGYLGVNDANDHLEIRLSPSAFQAEIRADPPTSVGLRDNVCLIRIPITPGELPALSRIAAAGGPVIVELVGESVSSPAASVGVNPAPAGSRVGPPPAPGESAAPPAPVAAAAAAAADAGSADTSSLGKINDLLGKALGPLPGAVKFDPVAMADYSIPASAAAAAIGSTTGLVRPATPREVVTGLLTDFDKDGKLQTGFSIAITPYTLLRKIPLTAKEYQEEPAKRILASLQLSLAARADESIVTNGAKAARFGAGLSVVLFDHGDLRLDNNLLRNITETLAGGRFSAGNVNDPGTVAPTPSGKLKAAGKLWDEEKARRWNAGSAGLGVAPAFLSFNGRLDGAKSDGVMAWVNLALPGPGALADSTQFIFGGNGRFKQRVQMDSVWSRANVIDLGAQLRYGGAAGNFFAEGQYRRRSADTATTTRFVYEFGYEHRLADSVWLNLSWTNDDSIQGGKLIRTGLRYGFGQKAVLAPMKD